MGVRKNQADLTADERDAFVQACLQVKANGFWDQMVDAHQQPDAMRFHNSPIFLPWHRELLRRMEEALQSVDPDVTIPYWDMLTGRAPGESPWTDDFLGQSTSGGVVSSGPFAFANGQWTLVHSVTGPALRRSFFGAQLPRESLILAVLSRTPYRGGPSSFSLSLETQIHNPGHVWVGGDMALMTSPNDPVFYLHHCNIDRLWARWMDQHPDQEPYLPLSGDPNGFNIDDAMPTWGDVTPADLIDHRSLGYEYDDDPAVDPGGDPLEIVVGGPPVPGDISAPGQRDPYRFQAAAPGDFVIETSGSTDVLITLAGPNDPDAIFMQDDDSGEGRNSRIETSLSAGVYFVEVRYWNDGGTGPYLIEVDDLDTDPFPLLTPGDAPIQSTIDQVAESEGYRIVIADAGIYRLETDGSIDTVLSLFGPNDDARLIEINDDGGPGLLSLIQRDLAPGSYLARVRHYNPNGSGDYSIQLSRVDGLSQADALRGDEPLEIRLKPPVA
ncbi:MAG: tyrosinase family protein [Thermoleophilia bacterium]|nr:tyrosinase family protein [Thermoleophilia bacterium]MDH3724460.1 tyrosinase family protein [Thermoleophilia bacterium]